MTWESDWIFFEKQFLSADDDDDADKSNNNNFQLQYNNTLYSVIRTYTVRHSSIMYNKYQVQRYLLWLNGITKRLNEFIATELCFFGYFYSVFILMFSYLNESELFNSCSCCCSRRCSLLFVEIDANKQIKQYQ